MTTMRRLFLVATLALPLLQGCLGMTMVGAGMAVATVEDRRTTGTQLEDRGIQLRASNRIDDQFGEKAHVNVTAYNRYVLLTGEVPDEATRSAIEAVARAVPNVIGVTDDLQIAGRSSTTSRSNDVLITSKVKARLTDDNRVNPFQIKVVTEASVVYLLGIVTEREAADAVEIARTTGGVRKVVKMFEYCKPDDQRCRVRK
jgi:osmotically-inducible protein OsmY